MTKKIIENKGVKYSEMLYELVQKFDRYLPQELTFEETLEVGIEAWNFANRKEFLTETNLYEKELKTYNHSETIDKMVSFKLKKFFDYKNIIIDFSTENNSLQVKTQTAENHFDSVFRSIIFNNSK
ncbi:MAG: hypothetical protein HKP48_07685 [Winogradskyella sp.]|uniref:hypothetical protein n=1 Tax=Winogradskyella sp. TaxID=1883156 RepID=UPI0017AF6018|nr:hypothetical protein [Winogradskyella sp.]MBT8244745.1 hypothetical protein [Winogradskyella sp.]NNK23163.1 hypothetical protein [Winogradskyella sp.]